MWAIPAPRCRAIGAVSRCGVVFRPLSPVLRPRSRAPRYLVPRSRRSFALPRVSSRTPLALSTSHHPSFARPRHRHGPGEERPRPSQCRVSPLRKQHARLACVVSRGVGSSKALGTVFRPPRAAIALASARRAPFVILARAGVGARPWQPVIHQQQVDTMRLFDGETGSAPAGWSQEPRTVMPPPFVHSTGRRAARRRPGTAAANTHSANGKTTWATQFSGHSEPSSRARSEGPSRGLCAALRQGGACGSGATPRRRHHPGPESGPWSRDVPRCGVASSTAWSRSSRVGTRFGSPRRRVLR